MASTRVAPRPADPQVAHSQSAPGPSAGSVTKTSCTISSNGWSFVMAILPSPGRGRAAATRPAPHRSLCLLVGGGQLAGPTGSNFRLVVRPSDLDATWLGLLGDRD